MDYSVNITIERDGIELELDIAGEVTPGSPGRRYGPPEDCYPPEDALAEVTSIHYNGEPWEGELSEEEEELARDALLDEFEDDDSFNEESDDD